MARATPNLRLVSVPSAEPKRAESVLDLIGDTPLLEHPKASGRTAGRRANFCQIGGLQSGRIGQGSRGAADGPRGNPYGKA